MKQSTKPARSTIMEDATDTNRYAQVVYAPTLEPIMREWSIKTEGLRIGEKICLSCIHDQGICKNLLYRKWYAYMRDSCTMYSTFAQQLGIDRKEGEQKE